MERVTKARMVSVFSFSFDEIEHLGLESQQYQFMEEMAREDLKENNLPYQGGDTSLYLGYREHDSTITIII